MKLRFRPTTGTFLVLLLLLLAFWRLGLGSLFLFDWDEINFAEIAREMCISGNFGQPTIEFLPFHEKPPLFSWLQAAAMQWTGKLDLAARLPNLLCGFFSLLLLFRIGRRIHSTALGWAWAAFMGLSILPSLYFRSGIIDPWFNLFLLLAADRIIHWELNRPQNWRPLLEASLWLGLALMTKGPAGGLILALFIALQLWRYRFRYWSRYLLIGVLALVPMTIWLIWLWPQDDGFFSREFLRYQWRLFSQPDAGHGGFPGYHIVVLLLGCFPASVFAWPALFRQLPTGLGSTVHYDRRMQDLFWVVLILFSIVSTKIVHYSSLCYFPITYLAARTYLAWQQGKWQPRAYWWKLLTGIWGLFCIAAILLPLAARQLSFWAPYRSQELDNWLSVSVDWPWTTFLPGLVAIGLLIFLIRQSRRADAQQTTLTALVGTALFLYLGLALIAGRIQQYSQGPLVEFYQNYAQEDVYFGTAYHKSYVPVYYGRLKAERGKPSRDWRFHGPIDADLYFSSPRRRKEQVLREVADAQLLYEKGGYAFYRRPAPASQ